MAMTQLPRFADEATARRWIEERSAETLALAARDRARRFTFAVVDDSRFLGSVSLYRSGASAYFSFWIGIDYQRRGIGTRAARISYRIARSELGVGDLFAASYHHNHPAHRVLLRGGWTRLPFRGEPPSHVLRFFHRPVDGGPASTRSRSYPMLATLLRDIGSDFVLAPGVRRGHLDVGLRVARGDSVADATDFGSLHGED